MRIKICESVQNQQPKTYSVTTTNPCEAWHNRLKSGAGIRDGHTATHGFFGCINNVHDSAHDIENNIRTAEIDSRTKKVTLTKKYPPLAEFPFAIQKLVATEENKVNTRITQNLMTPTPSTSLEDGLLECNCQFSRRYLLPCQHIFHIDRCSEEPILTAGIWGKYLERFG